MNKNLQNRHLAILLLMFLSLVTFAQNARTVSGKVTDKNGNALPGTNVVVQGTSTGVQADINGSYQIMVENPADAILEFSFIGYVVQRIPLGSQTIINVELSEIAIGLDEVVVIGYGTVKKRDLTGSVATIKSGEITKTATNNALQSMQGKISRPGYNKSQW